MFPVPLATSATIVAIDKFWEAVLLYHNRPHLINRKLVAVLQILLCEIEINCPPVQQVKDLFTKSALLYETRRLKSLTKDDINLNFIKNLVICYDKNVILSERNGDYLKNSSTGIFVSVRILLPKNTSSCKKCLELVILDKVNNIATFLPVFEPNSSVFAPPFVYDIELTSSGNLRINVNSIEDADTSQAAWLADKLFSKIIKWSEVEFDENTIQSLSLIPADEYYLTYSELKGKYGEKLVQEWPTKATTDPRKFVYEDIAIASYLICLWKKYKSKCRIKFVDCGCGNGLLVYILNQAGYDGFGLDIRRRATWDLYPKETILQEKVVSPTCVFPDCTWIIGNHSDELTPWIPIIALNSSNSTNFFVLPCCPYDLNGRKYIRTNTSVSQYSDYLNYIQNLCKMAGFKTEIDKLRIPSTKRTCLVGIRDETSEEDFLKVRGEVAKFVETRCPQDSFNNSFDVRNKLEKVRNCTQLNRNFIQKLVHFCICKILETENFIVKPNGDKWNKGGGIKLSNLSQLIPSTDLKELKNESGGLQTLLRNHRYLFEMKDGFVMLREPFQLNGDTVKYKNKPCWFFKNHPNGCLYDSETCAYKHC